MVDYNLRAICAYLKCGFAIEGRARECAFVDGIWHDDAMMAVLDHEYAEIQHGNT
jgi:RimJ/RimL family protein N-acetyltransferase